MSDMSPTYHLLAVIVGPSVPTALLWAVHLIILVALLLTAGWLATKAIAYETARRGQPEPQAPVVVEGSQ